MKLDTKFSMLAPITCSQVEGQDGKTLHTFRIVANAGSVMHFWDEDVVIDVEGVYTHSGPIPIVYGHMMSAGIGHSTNVSVEGNKLIVEGVVSRETKYADDFVSSSQNGFPWQASVGGYIRDKVELRKGETYDLHGKKIIGPATIATKFELFETSVVEYGADAQTSSVITASNSAKENDMEEKEKSDASVPENVQAADKENKIDDGIAQIRAAQADELQRIADIRARSLGNDEKLMAQAIKEGWSPDKFELESLRASRAEAPAIHTPSTDKVDAKALEIVAIRAAGFNASEKKYSDAQLTAADKIGNPTFLEFCERAMCAPAFSYHRDPVGSIRAAISTQNLGSILTTNANAVLLEAFNYADTSWREIFKISSVTDFKQTERWRIDTNFKLKEVPEGAEMEHAEVADESFKIKATVWGRQFTLGYQSIVNGDALGVFGDMLRQIAYGANEAVAEQAFGVFMNPATCSDGVAYYHATHGSLKTSCALTLDNLSAARAAFISRKKMKTTQDDSPLGIPPALLVVPTALEDKALMLCNARTFNNGTEANNPADYNPNIGRYRVVAAPSLGYATFTNYSDTTWYLLADPRRLAAFEIAFLNGKQTPYVRQDELKIGSLGIAFDAHLDFGVAQEDWRGAMKCTA